MKLVKIFLLTGFLLINFGSLAADPEPLVMLKSTSDQMLQELRKNLGSLKSNKKLVYSLVNRILVPHFDLVNMAQAVVGPYWANSSSDSQQQFIEEFKKYVISTYSSAFQSYSGETVKFYPIRGAFAEKVEVKSELLLKNGPPIQLQYRLLNKNGSWLIYDFSVDGVSIVKNYNSQFAGVLRQKGLAGLILELKQHPIK